MATHFSIFAWEIPWIEAEVAYSPCSCKQLETTELLDFHFSPALQADFLPSEPPGKTLCEIFNK